MDLSRLLAKEAEFFIIEKIFRQNPELHIKLLQFMNSAAFYTAQKITSIGQSIALLGYRNLQKWVTLLLFAGEGYDIKSTPLFERAVLRGRIMELLTGKVTRDASDSRYRLYNRCFISCRYAFPVTARKYSERFESF